MSTPDWTPATEPRTYTGGGIAGGGTYMAGAVFNDERDRISYLKGAMPAVGTFVTLTAAALASDTSITVDAIPADIPAGAVLHFMSGANKWARVSAEILSGDTPTIQVEPLPQALSAGDYAPWPQQAVVLIEAPVRVTPGIGAGREFDKLHHFHSHQSLTGTIWQHVARKVAALVDADRADFVFGLKRDGGSEELLARIRFFRDGGSTRGSIYITTNAGAGFPATPAIAVVWTGRVGINTAGPNYALDIAGDLDLTGDLIGVALWRENPAGTLAHIGSSRITHQYRSTVATGTAPFVGIGATMIRNLNVDRMGSLDNWMDAPTVNNNTVNVVTKATDYTVATNSVGMTAIFELKGEATVNCDSGGAGDQGATFSLQFKKGATVLSVRAGQVRLLSARKAQIVAQGKVALTNGDTVNMIARKDAGTGTSAVAGSFTLTPVGQV